MWSSIQARHPKEAVQLSNKHAVIRYDPSSPPHPPEQHQHPHHATESQLGSTSPAGDGPSAFVATYIEPVLPMGRVPTAVDVAAPSPSTSIRQNIFSRLVGLALLAPQASQAEAAPRNSEVAGSITSAETLSANEELSNSTAVSSPLTLAGYRLATRTTVRSTDRQSGYLYAAAASDRHATTAHPEAERTHRVASQPEVLRRAQAAFSNLREANGRRQAQGVS